MPLPSPSGVLCCGNIVFDILVSAVDAFAWNATTWVDSIGQSIGGNGANTTFTLARLGVPAGLIGPAGNDPAGERMIELLKDAGADISRIERLEEQTATTVALVRSDGARAFLHRPGVSSMAFKNPVTLDEVSEEYSHFHLANVFALPKLRRTAEETLRNALDRGMTTSLDTGWDARGEWINVAGPLLPHLDVLLVNEDEARHLSGASEPESAARFFLDRGTAAVVVKLGERGCYAASADFSFHAPSFEVNAIDTTGAGDCFTAGFLASLHYGAGPEDAARFANAVGALNVQSLGSVAGIRSYKETLEWMNSASTRHS